MDLIVGSENGTASSTDILNITDTLVKKLKKSETEHLLNRLVQDKWLNEVQHNLSEHWDQISLFPFVVFLFVSSSSGPMKEMMI